MTNKDDYRENQLVIENARLIKQFEYLQEILQESVHRIQVILDAADH